MTRDNPPYRDRKARTLPTRAHTSAGKCFERAKALVRNHLSSCIPSSEHLLFSKGRRSQNARETRQLGYTTRYHDECGCKIFLCVRVMRGEKGGNCISANRHRWIPVLCCIVSTQRHGSSLQSRFLKRYDIFWTLCPARCDVENSLYHMSRANRNLGSRMPNNIPNYFQMKGYFQETLINFVNSLRYQCSLTRCISSKKSRSRNYLILIMNQRFLSFFLVSQFYYYL